MKEQNYVLIEFKDNWADEMDLEGFRVVTKARWKELQEFAKKAFELSPKVGNRYIEVYFGTNESNSYENYTEYKKRLTSRGLSDAEVKLMKRLFPDAFKYGYGHIPLIDEERVADLAMELEEIEKAKDDKTLGFIPLHN